MERKKKDSKTGFTGFMRYKENNLTGREKNAFEKELQKDPFTEEADEGLSSLDGDILRKDMGILSKRLRRRTAGNRRIIFYSTAASVAVLMTVSALYFHLRRSEEARLPNAPVAMEISRAEPLKSKKDEAASEEKVVRTNQENTKKSAAGKSAPEGQIAENRQIEIAKDTIKKEEIAVSEKITSDNLSNISPAPPVSRPLPAYNTSSEISRKAVSVEDEKIAPGAGSRALYSPAEPVIGKASFDDYIQANMRKPDILKDGDKVVVVLSFLVRNNGSPDSIKVISSPGEQFSEEAVRLIKEGPKWKPATEKGNPIEEKAIVRIVFK
ncbi:MAG: energy transducer TonB [Bacteroidales bacterium]|jgi:hypothetical protein